MAKITGEDIPKKVWHTAMSTYHKVIRQRPGSAWQEAIAAALNAWPGAQFSPPFNGADTMMPAALHLPLPQTRKSGTYDDEFGKLWA